MSTTKSRKDLLDEFSQVVQWTGTLTVLHTNAVANKVGLSATEFEALDIIRQHQPVTAGHLATYCGLTTGAITGLVDRLEQAGYVRRVSDPSDRRKVLLEIIMSAEEFKKIHEFYEPMARAFDTLTQSYSTAELEFLIEANRNTNDMMEKVIAQVHDLQ